MPTKHISDRTLLAFGAIILMASVPACFRDSGATTPLVRALDSLVLAEPDSLEEFLHFRTQALTRDGGVILETGSSILRFNSTGALTRRWGRTGSGPGEFIRISTIVPLRGESLVAAVDARRGRIVAFRTDDGGLDREVMIQPFFPGQQWLLIGDTVVFPGKLSKQPFTSWLPTTDSLWTWGNTPPI